MMNSLVGVFSRHSGLFSREMTLITRAKKKKAAGGKKCKLSLYNFNKHYFIGCTYFYRVISNISVESVVKILLINCNNFVFA